MRCGKWCCHAMLVWMGFALGLGVLPATILAGQSPDQQREASDGYSKTVEGMTVRLGLASVREVRKSHADELPHDIKSTDGKRLHLLINLSDAASGAHIGAAKIVVEVQDPLDVHQKITLQPMRHDDITDYGEYFRFDMDGRYLIHATIWPKAGGASVTVTFQHNHARGH